MKTSYKLYLKCNICSTHNHTKTTPSDRCICESCKCHRIIPDLFANHSTTTTNDIIRLIKKERTHDIQASTYAPRITTRKHLLEIDAYIKAASVILLFHSCWQIILKYEQRYTPLHQKREDTLLES